ncbi:MAG: uracil-DNA glycosylase [Candidatus Aenigmarchaeota archaeon]|nr:uracil-DNA glycosylase [Candidatus Aenigmarchaeota archaeon]
MFLELEKLNRIIRNCKKCELWKTRTNAVPGEGPQDARIMFVGMAPGRTEDIEGRPFVGPAGKFLNKLLESTGIKRSEVFLTSPLKCFPPRNRKPLPKEIEACKPYLLKQIEIIRPQIIILLGEVALETLLKRKDVSNVRGKPIEKDGIIYFPTYHPAAGMRFPKIREKLLNDFMKLKKIIQKLQLS